MTYLKLKPTEEEIDKLLSERDTDEDGVISFPEFEAMMVTPTMAQYITMVDDDGDGGVGGQ